MGDEAFFEGLRQWVGTNLDGAADTADFHTLMESVSGVDLDRYFEEWVRSDGPPSHYPEVT